MGLTSEQIRCLLYIGSNEFITITNMARYFNCNKSTISRIVAKLYDNGFIIEKGKCELSSKGSKTYKLILIIYETLKKMIFKDEISKDNDLEIFNIISCLSNDSINRIIGYHSKAKLHRTIAGMKRIDDHWLVSNIVNGKYHFDVLASQNLEMNQYFSTDNALISEDNVYLKFTYNSALYNDKDNAYPSMIKKFYIDDKEIPGIDNVFIGGMEMIQHLYKHHDHFYGILDAKFDIEIKGIGIKQVKEKIILVF